MTKTNNVTTTHFGRFATHKLTKPLFGIAIILCYIIIMLALTSSNILGGWKVAANAILGLVMGYVLQRSFFGFAGTAARTGKGNPKLAYAVLFMFGFVAIIVALAATASPTFLGKVINGHARPIGLGTVLGAVIFGIGMTLAGACASGSLTDFGSAGSIRIAIVLIFFVIGAGPGQMIQNNMVGRTSDLGIAHPGSLVELLGGDAWAIFGSVVLTLAFLATMALVAYIVAKKIRENKKVDIKNLEAKMDENEDVYAEWLKINNITLGSETNKLFTKNTWWKFYFNVFARKMSLWMGALAFGGLMIGAILLNGKGWGVTTSFAKTFDWVFNISANDGGFIIEGKNHLNTFTTDSGTWRNLGLLLGALAYMLMSYKAKWISDWHGFKNKKTWAGYGTAALAGFFLGFGARIADGCNAGQWATGITTFSLSGWLFGIAMILGAAGVISFPFLWKRIKK